MSGLKKNLKSLPIEEKKVLIDRNHKELSVRRQCDLLNLNRSTLYYKPVLVDELTLRLMNRIDEIYTDFPFYGSRKILVALKGEGWIVGRDKVRSLMRKMGLKAIYPKPNLSKRNQEHKIYPYLLRGLELTGPEHVWSTDITYIRLLKGFVYLVAIIDWYSRYVLSWRISNTLEADFCIDALEEALTKGRPLIFNTDQGSQFTSNDFTNILLDNDIKISMDGKGRALDNVFVERLWRSVKYEKIYLNDYQTVREVKQGIKEYFLFYNTIRPHQSLDNRTPYQLHY